MMHYNHLPKAKEQQEPATRPRREGLLEDEDPCEGLHPSTEADQDQKAAPNSAPRAAVNFSEFSSLYHYDSDDLYSKTKSYSKKDCQIFSAQVMVEAHRIKRLIYNSPPSSAKESIKYVLRNNIVTSDEVVGIDHLIIGRRSSVLQVRRDHMTAVLWKQQEQRRRRQHQQPQIEENSLIELGKFAEHSSLKSTHSAIARATLSFSP